MGCNPIILQSGLHKATLKEQSISIRRGNTPEILRTTFPLGFRREVCILFKNNSQRRLRNKKPMHSPLLKGLHKSSYRCHSLGRSTDTQQLEKGKSPSWKEYHIHRLSLGKALHAHTKGERIVAQPIILGSPCWLHH